MRKREKLTTEIVKEKISRKGFELIGEYKKANKKITIKCNRCGNTYDILLHSLLAKRIKYCVLCTLPKIGQKFGRLKVVRYIKKRKSKYSIECECECGNKRIYKANVLKRRISCSKCNDKKIINKYPEIAEEWDFSKNKRNLEDIKYGCDQEFWWICKKCGTNYKTSPNLRVFGKSGCPNCIVGSRGEERIKEYLNELNISFIKERRFKDCRDKKPLPFDFWLPNYNLLIEYQGRQHYHKTKFIDTEKLIKHDNIKRNFCLENNIKLVEDRKSVV